MKKVLAFVLCLLLLGSVGVAEEVDALQQQALAVVTALVEGDFETIVDQFDDTMRAAVDEATLEGGLNTLVAQLGAVTGVGEIAADVASASAAAQILHENGISQLMLAFNAEGEISGLYIAPVSVVTAEERELPEGVTAEAVKLFEGTERELTGELLRPENADVNTPYVVFAQGSGPSDMDETIGANKPLRDLAYDLAALGVGSLRFDKITYAHPEWPVETVDQEYLEPVAEALRVLREQTDAACVMLIGHSEGGMLTPYLVQACGFDGGISIAGTPQQLWEISYAQNLAVIEAMPEEQQEALRAQVEQEREKALSLADLSEEEAASVTVFGMPGTYLAHMARMDQAQIALDSGKPFLFIWGEADFQVSREAFEAWQQRLGDDARFTYKTYPGLNHLMMPAGENDSILQAQAAYQEPKQVDPQVAKDIADWIAANKA